MRLVTWNCCKGPLSRKLAVLDQLGADVGVLCECPEMEAAEGWSYTWGGPNPRQGVAVVARGAYAVESVTEATGAAPYAVPAKISGPHSFALLAVWTQQDTKYVEGLRSVLAAYEDLLSGVAVLAGDLNSNAIWDAKNRAYSHSDFVSDMNARGFVSAYHWYFAEEHGAETRPTHYWRWNPDTPFHLDYCFVPRAWLAAVDSVSVVQLEPAAKISDHLPVVVDVSDGVLAGAA